jgi:hypothetical protein
VIIGSRDLRGASAVVLCATKGAGSAKSRPFVFIRLKISTEDQLYFCAVCCRPIMLNCDFCSSLSEV